MLVNSAWLITTKTNLEIGNKKKYSYCLTTEILQHEFLTGLPCINDSSLKGTIHEYCKQVVKLSPQSRKHIFGGATHVGAYSFFDAALLLLPVQDTHNSYHWITSESIIYNFKGLLNLFNIYTPAVSDINTLFDKLKAQCNDREIVLVSDREFNEICFNTERPILVRNRLKKRKSTKQVLPPQTVFYSLFFSLEDILSELLENKTIQMGAKTKLSYGYCHFTKLV